MSSLPIFVWIASVFLDTAGRLTFKSAAMTERETELQRWKSMLRSPWLWAGIICFCLEFAVWLALLSLIPLSQAVLIGSINIVVVMIAGRLIFHERWHRKSRGWRRCGRHSPAERCAAPHLTAL